MISKARFHLKLWALLVTVAFIGGIILGATAFRSIDEPSDRGRHQVFNDEKLRNDWAALAYYAAANATLPAPADGQKRIVFFGDSITEFWIHLAPEFFAGKPYVDRGIGGQTTPQLLVRFRQDVVALHPAVAVILGGINDLSGLTGPSTPDMIEANLQSMAELSQASGIRPVLASLLPNDKHTVEIAAINRWVADYAKAKGLVFLDYHPALADAAGGMRDGLTSDGLHPNRAGYQIMGPLAEKAIAQALASSIPPVPATDRAGAAPASAGASAPDSADRGKDK